MECGDILAPTRRGVGVVAKDRPNLAPTWVLVETTDISSGKGVIRSAAALRGERGTSD